MKHLTYTVLLEQAADGGWSAHVPDLPTILVGAESREEAESLVREAIELCMEDLRERGQKIPPPHVVAMGVEVAA